MNKNIKVIEANNGGLIIQNTETMDVASFDHKADDAALESLKAIVNGDDMAGWDLSEPECYISDEEYDKHASSGGYRAWNEDEINEHLST